MPIAPSLAFALFCACSAASRPADADRPWASLERGYWLHASLGPKTVRGYWAPNAPADPVPNEHEIRSAAALLTGAYGANCLYLMYHGEIARSDFERIVRLWGKHCPPGVEIVPTLVLRMYDKPQTRVFATEELRGLLRFCKDEINSRHIGWYDVLPDRPQAEELAILAEFFPNRIVRVGIQPEERIDPRCCRVVQDTWSGLCLGRTSDDWASPGFGREMLTKWIELRRGGVPVSWDLIVVAWDYAPTARGEYPGYDDDARNMPLPAGRNRLAARLFADRCDPQAFAGYSSDLFILQANSRNPAHDGLENSFYNTLKRGEAYSGYYAAPFRELTSIYGDLRDGLAPGGQTRRSADSHRPEDRRNPAATRPAER